VYERVCVGGGVCVRVCTDTPAQGSRQDSTPRPQEFLKDKVLIFFHILCPGQFLGPVIEHQEHIANVTANSTAVHGVSYHRFKFIAFSYMCVRTVSTPEFLEISLGLKMNFLT
jgi:hypothetical protein